MKRLAPIIVLALAVLGCANAKPAGSVNDAQAALSGMADTIKSTQSHAASIIQLAEREKAEKLARGGR